MTAAFLLPILLATPPNLVGDRHGHPNQVNAPPACKACLYDLQHIPYPFMSKEKKTSPGGRYIAFVADITDPKFKDQRDSLIVLDLQKNVAVRVRSIEFSHRLIDDLVWASSEQLQFDIWRSPHFAIHYVFDTKQMRVIWANQTHDEFF